MEGKDHIKEVFSKKLGNFEAKVNPKLWDKVAAQVTNVTATSAVSTSLSLVTKWMIGLGISAVVVTVAVISLTKEDQETITAKNTEINLIEEEIISSPTENTHRHTDTGTTIESVVETPKSIEENTIEPSNVTPSTTNTDATVNLIQLFLPTAEMDRDHLVGPNAHNADTQDQAKTTITDVGESPSHQEDNGISKEETPTQVEEKPTVNEKPEVEKEYSIGELPNVFTPNNDGTNEFFAIESSGLLDFNIVVLNGNEIIYTSQDPNFRWEGVDKLGNPVPSGNYVYFITARDSKGNAIKEYSGLSITR